jgi:hypothetical protein
VAITASSFPSLVSTSCSECPTEHTDEAESPTPGSGGLAWDWLMFVGASAFALLMLAVLIWTTAGHGT